MAEALIGGNDSLVTVDLGGNAIHDEGAEHISRALVFAQEERPMRLRRLDLRCNQIGPDGAAALAQCLRTRQTSSSRSCACSVGEPVLKAGLSSLPV